MLAGTRIGADDGGVDEDRDREAEADLLQHHQPSGREAAEDRDHDQGSAGDDPGGRLQADRDRLAVALVAS